MMYTNKSANEPSRLNGFSQGDTADVGLTCRSSGGGVWLVGNFQKHQRLLQFGVRKETHGSVKVAELRLLREYRAPSIPDLLV
jgi:hypothetical protein